jgi:glycosyltransferase involved in cell wall biosynthesis
VAKITVRSTEARIRPQVSVITPLYNYAEYVAYTIHSVLKQTCQDFEHIIVDDGSTDGSADVVRSFLSDNRIRLIELGKNYGHSVAKNIAIEASRANYITMIDADDMLTRDSLQIRLDYLRQHPTRDIVHGRVYVCLGPGDFTDAIDELGEEPWLRQRLLELNRAQSPQEEYWDAIHAQSVLCHRSVYERVGLYDEEMRWKADREMWHRMLYHGGCLGYVDAFVAIYRRHDRNISQSEERRKSNIEEVFRRKCRERSGRFLPDDIKRLRHNVFD